MTNLNFNSTDSFAIWNTPSEDLTGKDNDYRQEAFGKSYQPNHFPTNELPDDLETKLNTVDYVLVGMNPGNAAVNQDKDKLFLNFHGDKKSMDYRLAAAVYGTKLWGTFMSDLSHIIESDSKNVAITQADVTAFEKHLSELGVPEDATLIAMGLPTFHALNEFSSHPVVKIPHYSGSNNGQTPNRWNADNAREQVLAIVEK